VKKKLQKSIKVNICKARGVHTNDAVRVNRDKIFHQLIWGGLKVQDVKKPGKKIYNKN